MSRVTWWSWWTLHAHARRDRSRGGALCGIKLAPKACYASSIQPRCPRCMALADMDPLAFLADPPRGER